MTRVLVLPLAAVGATAVAVAGLITTLALLSWRDLRKPSDDYLTTGI